MGKKSLYLVRHCEPDMSKGIRYDVMPGPPLSERGKKQALELRDFFSNIRVKEIYCSPFTRTVETAKLGILAEGRELIIVDELKEIRDDEPWENVKKRVNKWLNEVKVKIEDNSCIVAHGATIEALLLAFGVDIRNGKRFKNDNILPQGSVWKIVVTLDDGENIRKDIGESESLDGGLGLGLKINSSGIVHLPINFSE